MSVPSSAKPSGVSTPDAGAIASSAQSNHAFSSGQDTILVMDFGSQTAQLICRRVRDSHVYCQLVRHDLSLDRIKRLAPKGIILSGGPSSVYEDGSPKCDPGIFELGIPVLGICYGMQLAAQALGSKVVPGSTREFGRTALGSRATTRCLPAFPPNSRSG